MYYNVVVVVDDDDGDDDVGDVSVDDDVDVALSLLYTIIIVI